MRGGRGLLKIQKDRRSKSSWQTKASQVPGVTLKVKRAWSLDLVWKQKEDKDIG